MVGKAVIHNLDDGRNTIQAIVGDLISGSAQGDVVRVTLSWNGNQNRCGPFSICVGLLPDEGEQHFDLVLHPDIPVPIPEVIARIFSDQVGLRPYKGEEKCPDSDIYWGRIEQSPCYVLGVGTPYTDFLQFRTSDS